MAALYGGVMLLDQRRYGWPSLRLSLPPHHALRPLARRCTALVLPIVSNMALVQLPILLLGLLGGDPTAPLLYATTRTLVGAGRQGASLGATAAAVEQSRLEIRAEVPLAAGLFSATARSLGWLTGLAEGGVALVGAAFLQFWTRGALSLDPVLTSALLLAALATTPLQGAAAALRFSPSPKPLIQAALLSLCLCLILLPPAILWGGGPGASLAVGLSEVSGLGLVASLSCCRRLDLPLGRHLLQAWGSALAGFALILASGLMLAALSGLSPQQTGLAAWKIGPW